MIQLLVLHHLLLDFYLSYLNFLLIPFLCIPLLADQLRTLVCSPSIDPNLKFVSTSFVFPSYISPFSVWNEIFLFFLYFKLFCGLIIIHFCMLFLIISINILISFTFVFFLDSFTISSVFLSSFLVVSLRFVVALSPSSSNSKFKSAEFSSVF